MVGRDFDRNITAMSDPAISLRAGKHNHFREDMMPEVTVNGVTLYYEMHGSGDEIVAI